MTDNLDILLVNIGGTRKKVYQGLSKDFSAVEPPFWAALTAGYLRKHGFRVDILDANVRNLDLAETAEEIVKRSARFTDIVVYSQQANTCSPIMAGVRQLCREIKHRAPDLKLVLSGWHPSALPKRTLQEEACDFVVQGEGFKTLLGLLENRNLSNLPGLWWKANAEIHSSRRPPNITDLTNELSEVAWDLLPLESENYRAFNWMSLQSLETRNHYAGMFTSLGCPYHCTFCGIRATFGERRIRYWSPEWALKQFDILASRGVKHINLVDELFVFNPKHYLPIARGLIERNYGLNFCAFGRVDRVDTVPAEDLDLLKRAGFNWLKLGIESINDEVLQRAHKGNYNKEVVRRVVNKIHNAGIDLCANYMFGLPGDTQQSMQEMLDFAIELNCAFPSFFCAMATPGSDLYDEAVKKGIPLPDQWVGYAQQGYEFLPLPTETLSSADVLRFRDNAFHIYFTNPTYLASIEKKFGRAAREHIESMTKIRLKRKLLGD